MILSKLDTIDWHTLGHAYGPADDVPGLIRGLTEPDPERRKKVLYELYGNIFHQGTRYGATPYAIPFLYELIETQDTPSRDQIVYLLVSLALGYEESYLPKGLDACEFRRELAAQDAEFSPSDRAKWAECGVGPLVDLACYDAVRKGVPTLIALLSNHDAAVRRAAVYALAWFPEDAELSLPALQSLALHESTDNGIANAVIAIGLLARNSSQAEFLDMPRTLLSHHSLVVRTAAAIALARSPLQRAIFDVLQSALVPSAGLHKLGEEIHFKSGDLAGSASLALGGAS